MDEHISRLNTNIQNKENELNAPHNKIQKLEEEIAILRHKKINCEKIGNSREVINQRLRSDLRS